MRLAFMIRRSGLAQRKSSFEDLVAVLARYIRAVIGNGHHRAGTAPVQMQLDPPARWTEADRIVQHRLYRRLNQSFAAENHEPFGQTADEDDLAALRGLGIAAGDTPQQAAEVDGP